MEIRVKNEYVELVLVRILESTDSSTGHYVVGYTLYDYKKKLLHTGIIARREDGTTFGSIREIIELFGDILLNSKGKQAETYELYLIGLEEMYEARAEAMGRFIDAVEEFLRRLSEYYWEFGEPPPLRYEKS